MSDHRRFMAVVLVAVSCLFTMQPAVAEHAFDPLPADPLCRNVQPLPANFPDWIDLPEQDDNPCVVADAGALCDPLGPTTGNSSPMSILPPDAVSRAYDQRNGPECAMARGATKSADNQVPIEGSIAAIDQPAASETPVQVSASSDDAVGKSEEPDLARGRPSNIGPSI